MKIIDGLNSLKTTLPPAVLTIGVFDGVHIGHRKIIKTVVGEAKKRRLRSVVVTFDPHPMKVVAPHIKTPSLVSLKHRLRMIEELGVDALVILRFGRAIAEIPAETFVKDILIDKLGMEHICVGHDFYFGKGGKFGIKDLGVLGRSLGFKVTVVRPVKVRGKIASSSLIRRLIMSGDLDEASALLGRRVSALGTVVSGARLARELGYPTANLNPHHEVIPPSGVYAVFVKYKGKAYKGILNIGVRPTFYAPRDQEPAIEVHIFDFNGKIYGKDLEVFFVKKLRKEIAFKSKDELVEQIKDDEKRARRALKGINIDYP